MPQSQRAGADTAAAMQTPFVTARSSRSRTRRIIAHDCGLRIGIMAKLDTLSAR